MKLTSIFSALTLAVGLFTAQAVMANETPATLDGVKTATAEDVQKLQAAGATIVDTRITSEYAEEHIKGAVSVAYHEKSAKVVGFDAGQDEFAVAKLPASKGQAIVMYCNGPTCWKSYKASVVAAKAGYTNIHWYRAGFPDWKAKGLPVE